MANGVGSTASGSSRNRPGAWIVAATERPSRPSRRRVPPAEAQAGRGESRGELSPLPPSLGPMFPPPPRGLYPERMRSVCGLYLESRTGVSAAPETATARTILPARNTEAAMSSEIINEPCTCDGAVANPLCGEQKMR